MHFCLAMQFFAVAGRSVASSLPFVLVLNVASSEWKSHTFTNFLNSLIYDTLARCRLHQIFFSKVCRCLWKIPQWCSSLRDMAAASHYSKNLIFVPKLNFEFKLSVKFEFCAKNWKYSKLNFWMKMKVLNSVRRLLTASLPLSLHNDVSREKVTKDWEEDLFFWPRTPRHHLTCVVAKLLVSNVSLKRSRS